MQDRAKTGDQYRYELPAITLLAAGGLTRVMRNQLSAGIAAVMLLSSASALAQGFGEGFGPAGGMPQRPTAEPAPSKPGPDDAPELHAASGGSESTIQEGNEPTLPADPLTISDETRARLGTDFMLEELELGKEPVTDRDFYGLYYHEQSHKYQLKLAFPLWMERTQPSLTDPTTTDRASVFGGLYYNRRSAERSDDILFPLFWNLRSQATRTTIVGPFVNRVAPLESDNWLAPLYFFGEREHGSYHIIPPLLTYMNRDAEGGFNLIGPGFCSWSKATGCFGDVEERDWGIAPLFFAGKDRSSDYRLIPPLLHYHEAESNDGTSLDVWGPLYRETTNTRDLFHLMPVYWSIWGEHERHTTVFPFFHHGWNKNASLTVTPLFLNGVSEEGNTTFASWLYARYRGRTELDMYSPLLWLYRDPDIELDQTLLFPFYYRRTSPRENSIAVFPFYGQFQRYGLSKSTWVTPFFNHSRDLTGWSTNLHPIAYFGRDGHSSHSVLAPIFWDFADPASRSTIVAPLYWRFAKPDSLTQLIGNVLYTETRSRQGLDWKVHILPALSYGQTPDGHSWDLLFGLVGYTRRAAETQMRLFWIPITLSESADAVAAP